MFAVEVASHDDSSKRIASAAPAYDRKKTCQSPPCSAQTGIALIPQTSLNAANCPTQSGDEKRSGSVVDSAHECVNSAAEKSEDVALPHDSSGFASSEDVSPGTKNDFLNVKESKGILQTSNESLQIVECQRVNPVGGNLYVTTSVTVTPCKVPVTKSETQVVKSVYTTKTGNSTRVFTVETTTDSVTRRNSMAVTTEPTFPPSTTEDALETSDQSEISNCDRVVIDHSTSFLYSTSNHMHSPLSSFPRPVASAPTKITDSSTPETYPILDSTKKISRFSLSEPETLAPFSNIGSQTFDEWTKNSVRRVSSHGQVKNIFPLEAFSKTDISSPEASLKTIRPSDTFLRTDVSSPEASLKTIRSSDAFLRTDVSSPEASLKTIRSSDAFLRTDVSSEASLKTIRPSDSFSRTDGSSSEASLKTVCLSDKFSNPIVSEVVSTKCDSPCAETCSKSVSSSEARKAQTSKSWSRTELERERHLAGMQFCAFLFRKGRIRPRVFGVRRGPRPPPVFAPSPPSPASRGPSTPATPLDSATLIMSTALPVVGEEACIAVVSSPVNSPSFEVIDHRSKNVEQILEVLKKGTQLWKIRSFTKWYRRSYYLDDKEGTVRYEPSHKAPCMHSPLRIAVDDIVDVRKGWKTDTFNKIEKKVERRRIKFPSQPSPVDERCCFSIIYSNNKQSLDLCAPEPKIADMWVRGLRHIVTVLRGLHQEERFERWLEQQFYEADVDKNNGLNFEESLKLLKQLNVKMPRSSVKKIFDEANTVKHSRNGEEVIDVDEFVLFYMKLMSRSDIKEIYLRYCKNNKEMTVSDLVDFIHKEQKGHDTTKEECLTLIEAFEQSNLRTEGKLSLIGFTNMLMSEQFDVLKQYHKVVYQDMHQPLSHYYIATSHNTYLTGNQLHGESSVEGYIDALKQGCRCVELDCWDGPDGDPIIYHGYTLTSKILFRDVLVDAIKPYAFYASEYPVILSLENHLTPKQQEVLTKHLIEVLGDMLYTAPVNESWEFLPSPEDLKNKVIIKAKKKASSGNVDGEDSNSEDEATPPPGIQPIKNDPTKGRREVAPGLSSLVNVCEAVHFHSFEDTEANQKCYQMSSFSEAKANKFIETRGADFVKYNTKHLSRIYPAGTRTDSSNFKPIPYWNVGCQLVALNYQHAGKPMLFNDAKFQDNGGCGYVLKPEFLRKKGYDPESTLNDKDQVTLKLTVISGQHIPKADLDSDGEIVDPYVKVKIIGHPKDNQKFKTEAVRNNGFNPIWNNEMTFNIQMPELAVIHFIVKDLSNTGKDVTLGTYAIPFMSIQEGYSHVYLKDYNRKFVSPASLFIHVCVI